MSELPTDYRVYRFTERSDFILDVLEVIWEHADFYKDTAELHRTTAPASGGLLAVWACQWYRGEVMNGGHEQFFWHSTGMIWKQVLAGFRLFELENHFRVLDAAVHLFPDATPSFDRELRIEQMACVDKEQLGMLDHAFDDAGDPEPAMVAYIKKHPDEFFLPE